jgi:predicted MFS family arabinose efflux permease
MAGLVNLARIVFAPLLGEFIAVFSVGEGTAGLIATLVWLGSAIPRIPTGWLLTRFSRQRVVVAAGGTLTLAAAFTASADSVVVLAVGAALMGVASGVYFVAANPYISELFPDRVGRMLGVHGAANQVAAVGAAPFVALVLVATGDWRLVFWGVSAAALASTAAIALGGRGADLPAAGAEDRDLFGAARAQWRVVALGVVVMGLTGFVWQGLFNFYELFMQSKGVADATARNLLTLAFAAGIPAFVLGGRLADRLPKVPYLLAIVAAFAASVAALTVASGVLALAALTVVVGYVIHSTFPAIDTYLLEALPDDSRASAYSVYSGSMMVVQAGGSTLVGALAERGVAYDAVFGALALALGAVAAVLVGLQAAGRLPD